LPGVAFVSHQADDGRLGAHAGGATVAATESLVDVDDADDALIDAYVRIDPRRPDPGEARLAAYGYPVWILIDALTAADQDAARVARDYEIPADAVRAAVAFYRRHRDAIDAQARANAAVFGANA
jgi:uncharacterized protein (DUF433 family)